MNFLDGHHKTRIVCTAFGCITIIEVVALLMGHNGLLIASSIATITGIAGGVLGFTIARN